MRTILDGVLGSAFKHVRDLILYLGSSIREHLHSGDEEISFVISGTGIMVVDGEECAIGPGSAILTRSGSDHGLRNESAEDLRIVVVCARTIAPVPK